MEQCITFTGRQCITFTGSCSLSILETCSNHVNNNLTCKAPVCAKKDFSGEMLVFVALFCHSTGSQLYTVRYGHIYTDIDGICVTLSFQGEPKPSTSRQSPRNSDSSRLDFFSMPSRAFEKAEELARRVWAAGWMVVHHNHLPKWLRDNDFLVKGHRPPMNSYWKCFKSVFRVHTETGNIWTHLLGMKNILCE